MGTTGKVVVDGTGKRGLKSSGKAACFDSGGACSSCCGGCTPTQLASQTLNRYQTWVLTSYQGPGVATPYAYWRIFLINPCPGTYVEYWGKGCVDQYGELALLPNSIQNYLSYTATVALQIGCYNATTGQIDWPGTCWPSTSSYTC